MWEGGGSFCWRLSIHETDWHVACAGAIWRGSRAEVQTVWDKMSEFDDWGIAVRRDRKPGPAIDHVGLQPQTAAAHLMSLSSDPAVPGTVFHTMSIVSDSIGNKQVGAGQFAGL